LRSGKGRLAIADSALGFWKALGEVCPKITRETANVLNKLPASQQRKVKQLCRSAVVGPR